MIERSVCIVPGCCNSSAKYAGYRYICSRHWRDVPRWMKRRDRALIRRYKDAGLVRDSPDGLDWQHLGSPAGKKAYRTLTRSWNLIERAAIRRAAGL